MNNLLLESPNNFKSLREYKQFLKQFPIVTKVEEGRFYSYIYDYAEDYDFDVLKYFDFFPLTIFFNKTSPLHIYGTNFHHIPLLTRNWFISRIKNQNTSQFKPNNKQKLNVTFNTLKSLLKKTPAATRLYRTDRQYEIRLIPNHMVAECVKFQPPTFHAVQFPAVVQKYKHY